MNRRGFIRSFCTIAAVATVAPSIAISMDHVLDLKAVGNTVINDGEVMKIYVDGKAYWYYREMEIQMRKWRNDLENRICNPIYYKGISYENRL